MRLIAFIEDPAVIEKILRHLLAALAITVAHEANTQATVTATAGRVTVRSMIGDQNLKFVVPSDRVVEVFGIP